jgi:hypothetical protein
MNILVRPKASGIWSAARQLKAISDSEQGVITVAVAQQRNGDG